MKRGASAFIKNHLHLHIAVGKKTLATATLAVALDGATRAWTVYFSLHETIQVQSTLSRSRA